MKEINTFRGSKPLAHYHKICCHEHLLIDMTHEAVAPKTDAEREVFYGTVTMDKLGLLRRNPYVVRENLILSDENDAINELTFLKKHQVDLIVDVTTIGLGRDIRKLKKISENTDIDVVIGTGLFVHDSLDEKYSAMKKEEIAAWMIDEIENGIEDTGIRAGVIGEIGVSEKIYPIERESLLAAAIAHKKTGLPIYVHTYPWSRAMVDAAELLIDNGVAPHNICICHVDVSFNREYIDSLLKLGVYIEFDNFGKEYYFEAQDGAFAGGAFETDVDRVRMIKSLIEEGYVNQLMIANDICLKASLHKYGGWGYDHIFENIAPMMRMEKINPEDIIRIIEKNPLRFLSQEQ